jgi:hypothetical protein
MTPTIPFAKFADVPAMVGLLGEPLAIERDSRCSN